MKVHCSNCGTDRTTVTRATLDERYPEVVCSDCHKRAPGIREDAFDRKRWEEQRAEIELAKAVKKAGLRKA